jgi:hypothetical protein
MQQVCKLGTTSMESLHILHTESPPIEFSNWDGFSDEEEDPSLTQLVDFDDIEYQIWEQNLVQELQLIQDQDLDLGQDLSRDLGQDLSRDQVRSQDIRSQKRQYSIESLESMDPKPIERRYPFRKRQLTIKTAALFIE